MWSVTEATLLSLPIYVTCLFLVLFFSFLGVFLCLAIDSSVVIGITMACIRFMDDVSHGYHEIS